MFIKLHFVIGMIRGKRHKAECYIFHHWEIRCYDNIIFIQQELEGSVHHCRSKSFPEYSMVLCYSVQSHGKFRAACLMLFPQIITMSFSLEPAVPFSHAGPAYPGEQSQWKKSQSPTHLPWAPQEAIPPLWHISSIRTQPGALFRDSAGCSKS